MNGRVLIDPMIKQSTDDLYRVVLKLRELNKTIEALSARVQQLESKLEKTDV